MEAFIQEWLGDSNPIPSGIILLTFFFIFGFIQKRQENRKHEEFVEWATRFKFNVEPNAEEKKNLLKSMNELEILKQFPYRVEELATKITDYGTCDLVWLHSGMPGVYVGSLSDDTIGMLFTKTTRAMPLMVATTRMSPAEIVKDGYWTRGIKPLFTGVHEKPQLTVKVQGDGAKTAIGQEADAFLEKKSQLDPNLRRRAEFAAGCVFYSLEQWNHDFGAISTLHDEAMDLMSRVWRLDEINTA